MRKAAHWWSGLKRRLRLPRSGEASGETGITYIEIAFMMLIVSILIVSLTNAIQVAARGTLAAKERSRALSLARDRLEEVKNFGYTTLSARVSLYYYPEVADADSSLHQRRDLPPYPVTPPSAGDDPWTPEVMVDGNIGYWRHVVVKQVEEIGDGGDLQMRPLQNPAPPCLDCDPLTVIEPGGTSPLTHLIYLEVDVTWFSRRTHRMEQVRVSTLSADVYSPQAVTGSISGTVYCETGIPNPVAGVVPDADDKPVTVAKLAVVARDTLTGASYLTYSNTPDGTYVISNLPNGSYYLDLRGAPLYDDSGFTNQTGESQAGLPMVTVDIDDGTKNQNAKAIWTRRVNPTRVDIWAQGINAGPAKTIVVAVSDGMSLPVNATLSGTITCTAASPCWFSVPNVAWPSSGQTTYRITLNDVTDNTTGSATIFLDKARSSGATDYFVVGANPGLAQWGAPNANRACASYGAGNDYCVSTADYAPVSISTTTSGLPASVKVKVQEFIGTNSAGTETQDLSAANVTLARVVMSAGSTTATLLLDSSGLTMGTTVFTTVPPNAGQVTFKAYMTSTGWDTDSYFLPFNVQPGWSYDLIPGETPPPDPVDSSRHIFVLHRVATITGTVYKADGTGKSKGKVTIRNISTNWNNTITADNNGVFTHASVPISGNVYSVAPVADPDFVSVPPTLDVQAKDQGTVYRVNAPGTTPLAFTLVSVNGIIKGTINQSASKVFGAGATVIASTYDTTSSMFVSSMPSSLLSAQYTYSVVTLADGTYRLKVATGVGNYNLYVTAVVDGVQKFVRVGGIVVVPDVDPAPTDVTLP